MSPATPVGRPLHYFIHDDCDALRMEIVGSLAGSAAQRAYEAWRRASLMARRQPLVIDISYVTEADEYGRAVLQAWRQQGAWIVASSGASRAIADSVLNAPVPRPLPQRTVLARLAFLFSLPTAGSSASAEASRVASAGAKQKSTENVGFLVHSEMEQQVR
jgi:hypothetical protein